MTERILVVVDPHAAAAKTVQEGIAWAQAHTSEIIFFSVMPQYTMPVVDMPPLADVTPQAFERAARSEIQDALDAAGEAAQAQGVMWRGVVGVGEDAPRCIVDAALKHRCRLIVAGTDGNNAVVRLLTGSVIPGLITASPLPLLIVEPGAGAAAPPRPLRRLLVVVEERAGARSAITEGVRLAQLHHAEIVFWHAWPQRPASGLDAALAGIATVPADAGVPAPGADRRVERALTLARRAGVAARSQALDAVASGHAVADAAAAADCDLVVVASEGSNALARIVFGSVVPGLVTAACVPLLIGRDEPPSSRSRGAGGVRRRRRRPPSA